jgi:flagellar biosynthesis/type III secretory pathway protein FliH
MGRVIKAADLWAPPVRLGERRRRELLRALAADIEDTATIERSRARIVELALGMARRIVGREVELEPALLDGIYRGALAELGALPPAALHVHPADRAGCEVDRLAAELGCAVVDDPAVGRGGCRVRGAGAEVDASIDALIEALRRALGGRRDA